MKKRVKCVDLLGRYGLISVGNTYDVIEESEISYVVENDLLRKFAYLKDAFVVVDEDGNTGLILSDNEKSAIRAGLNSLIKDQFAVINSESSNGDIEAIENAVNGIKSLRDLLTKFQ